MSNAVFGFGSYPSYSTLSQRRVPYPECLTEIPLMSCDVCIPRS
jgi:hypothetical protein